MRRVAVMLFSKLEVALEMRQINLANSCPYWLEQNQYVELDDRNGFGFLPEMAPLLMMVANQKGMCPLGLVVIEDDGTYNGYMNRESIADEDMEFSSQLFEAHAHAWFCMLPLWGGEGIKERV